MNKFEFISTGKISVKKKSPDRQLEEISEFTILKEFLIEVRHERNVTPIRMFEHNIIDLVAAQNVITTFILSLPISMGYRLVDQINKNPVVVFNDERFFVNNFSYEQNDTKQAWNLVCNHA